MRQIKAGSKCSGSIPFKVVIPRGPLTMKFDHVSLEKGREALHENTLFIDPDKDPTTWNTHVAMNAILCALEDHAEQLRKIEDRLKARD